MKLSHVPNTSIIIHSRLFFNAYFVRIINKTCETTEYLFEISVYLFPIISVMQSMIMKG